MHFRPRCIVWIVYAFRLCGLRMGGWFHLGRLHVDGWFRLGGLCVNGYFVCEGLRGKM